MDHRRVGSTISSNRSRKKKKKNQRACSFSQKEIMEMQCDLLVSNFKDQKTIGLVKENIRQISGGSCSHRAAALHLGLEKAFELKKRKRQASGTRLRCSRVGCSSYTDHVSLSSIGVNTHFCNKCSNLGCYRFLCASCGYNRTGNYTSCQGCAKTFI